MDNIYPSTATVQVPQDVDKRVPAVHVGIQGPDSQPQNIKGPNLIYDNLNAFSD